MDFIAARKRIDAIADVAPKETGILTVAHLSTIFSKNWRVSNAGDGEINLHRPTESGCEYATLTLDGDGLDRLLTPREIQDGAPVILRKQA